MTDTLDPKSDHFLDGLVKIVTDLEKARTRDPEVVAMIGSLADRLINDAGKSDWPEVKASLSAEERKSLIGTFSREIQDSGSKGEIKTAYAMQAIAASLVGAGFDSERITTGVDLLDTFIAASRDYFVRNAPKPN
jgi:hypothetical protein